MFDYIADKIEKFFAPSAAQIAEWNAQTDYEYDPLEAEYQREKDIWREFDNNGFQWNEHLQCYEAPHKVKASQALIDEMAASGWRYLAKVNAFEFVKEEKSDGKSIFRFFDWFGRPRLMCGR